MANKTIIMTKLRQILRYHTQGKSKLLISRYTGVSRNTVKRYIRKFEELHLGADDIAKMNDHELDQYFAQAEPTTIGNRFDVLQGLLPLIERQLKRKGNTIEKAWQQYRKANPDGYSITQFYHYYREHCKKANTTMHMNHQAGDKMYIDYAGDRLEIVDITTGEVTKVEVFAAILGCSQLLYVEALSSQKKEDLIKGTENALHYFGGVPLAIVPDNLRAAVTKSSRYEPIINETFADFAEHYNTAVLPARAYRPRDKSLVEGAVKIIYRRIYSSLQDKIFGTLAQLNIAIRTALEEHNNAPFKGRGYSRWQQFNDVEKSVLKPLPQFLYDLKQQAMATVMKNGHVCLGIDKHYYSVPYSFIGKKIKLLYSASLVEIFYRYECIAKHKRNAKRYQYTTVAEHLASAHRYVSDWTPEKFIRDAQEIHEDVALYIQSILEHKQHPEQAYKSCSGILHLHRKFGSERLINACRRAQSYRVFNYPIILQILGKNLDSLTAEEQLDAAATTEMPEHDNIRGKSYYH
jgi:hypothetical protein